MTVTENGYEQRTETIISLVEAIDRDLEGFLDFLDEITMPPNGTVVEDAVEYELGPLSDIDYEVVGLSDEGALRLLVTGYREATVVE